MNGVERQFQTVRNTQLVKDVVQMVFHRLLTDKHPLGHFLVLEPLRDQHDDLFLALAQNRALLAEAETRACIGVRRGAFL